VTRGAIDLKIVVDRLAIARRAVEDLRALPSHDLQVFLLDRRNAGAADSYFRRALEGLFDAARHVLAKAYGQAGLEYRQVARECVDRGLVTDAGLGARLTQMAGFRNRLTHHYDEVTPEEMFGLLDTGPSDIEAVARELEVSARRLAAPPPPPEP
jgi:uncharacterized protein YutE (UPF0331/DUF86 family)